MQHIKTLIGTLELMAMEDDDSGLKESAKTMMDAAGYLGKLCAALQPFADAALKADKASDEQKRMLGSEISEDASPGWGIRRKHLNAAREILGQNVKEHATLSAGASVDHGVEVGCRQRHENRAADRGCVSRLVRRFLFH